MNAGTNDYPMTVEMIMEYIHVRRNTVLRLLKEGKIRAKKVGKRWIAMKSEVDRYLKDFDDK